MVENFKKKLRKNDYQTKAKFTLPKTRPELNSVKIIWENCIGRTDFVHFLLVDQKIKNLTYFDQLHEGQNCNFIFFI